MEDKAREVESMNFLQSTFSHLSSLCSSPLFSAIITLQTLAFLYLPSLFLRISFSPVLISTGILLLTLLRLGASQRKENSLNSTSTQAQEKLETQSSPSPDQNHEWVSLQYNPESETKTSLGHDSDLPEEDHGWVSSQSDSGHKLVYFTEWDVRAPLEIIYEAYEGEEEDDADDGVLHHEQAKCDVGMSRYPSLSLYYPESDSDGSSDGEFPAIGGWDLPEGFRWDEEEREGLIEIALDGTKRPADFSHAEEENLIEIDIFPVSHDGFPGYNRRV